MKCTGYVQTTEKGASLQLRDSCIKCGRTQEAHRRDSITPEEEAMEWIKNNGYSRHPFSKIALDILTKFLQSRPR